MLQFYMLVNLILQNQHIPSRHASFYIASRVFKKFCHSSDRLVAVLWQGQLDEASDCFFDEDGGGDLRVFLVVPNIQTWKF